MKVKIMILLLILALNQVLCSKRNNVDGESPLTRSQIKNKLVHSAFQSIKSYATTGIKKLKTQIFYISNIFKTYVNHMFNKILVDPYSADKAYYKIMSFSNDTVSFIHDKFTKHLFKLFNIETEVKEKQEKQENQEYNKEKQEKQEDNKEKRQEEAKKPEVLEFEIDKLNPPIAEAETFDNISTHFINRINNFIRIEDNYQLKIANTNFIESIYNKLCRYKDTIKKMIISFINLLNRKDSNSRKFRKGYSANNDFFHNIVSKLGSLFVKFKSTLQSLFESLYYEKKAERFIRTSSYDQNPRGGEEGTSGDQDSISVIKDATQEKLKDDFTEYAYSSVFKNLEVTLTKGLISTLFKPIQFVANISSIPYLIFNFWRLFSIKDTSDTYNKSYFGKIMGNIVSCLLIQISVLFDLPLGNGIKIIMTFKKFFASLPKEELQSKRGIIKRKPYLQSSIHKRYRDDKNWNALQFMNNIKK